MNQKKAGVLLSYGQTALSTLISLTYTPVMLRLLGQSEYGLYTPVSYTHLFLAGVWGIGAMRPLCGIQHGGNRKPQGARAHFS